MTQAELDRLRLYPELRYGGYSRRDGTVAFYLRVNALLSSDAHVLDYGCGTGAHIAALAPFVRRLQVLRGKAAIVDGTDVDPAASSNPYIDRFVPCTSNRVPLDDRTIDICIGDWCVEHLDDIDAFFAECRRLLRPGGYLCVRTPNRWHYSSIGASLIPFRFHHKVRKAMGQFHEAHDVFPTLYRCNTRAQLSRKLMEHGFEGLVYSHRGESHLAGMGRSLGAVGERIERASPPGVWHELHAFGRKTGS